mmetsp:Transcript_10558/g.25584  ORF Transcript_10558/g.25584 Transcript_10558/m.25584 type:complete len:218 (+) Transcript_10558:94-747(+)
MKRCSSTILLERPTLHKHPIRSTMEDRVSARFRSLKLQKAPLKIVAQIASHVRSSLSFCSGVLQPAEDLADPLAADSPTASGDVGLNSCVVRLFAFLCLQDDGIARKVRLPRCRLGLLCHSLGLARLARAWPLAWLPPFMVLAFGIIISRPAHDNLVGALGVESKGPWPFVHEYADVALLLLALLVPVRACTATIRVVLDRQGHAVAAHDAAMSSDV